MVLTLASLREFSLRVLAEFTITNHQSPLAFGDTDQNLLLFQPPLGSWRRSGQRRCWPPRIQKRSSRFWSSLAAFFQTAASLKILVVPTRLSSSRTPRFRVSVPSYKRNLSNLRRVRRSPADLQIDARTDDVLFFSGYAQTAPYSCDNRCYSRLKPGSGSHPVRSDLWPVPGG